MEFIQGNRIEILEINFDGSGNEDLWESECIIVCPETVIYFYGEKENGSLYYPHTQKSVPNGLKAEILMAQLFKRKK